jgi:SAM-dependent methyltransferase
MISGTRPRQLGGLDRFHTRGLAAITELGKLARITAEMSVLDVGSGVGGPALSGCDLWLSGNGRRPQRAIRGRRALSGRAHGRGGGFRTGSALGLPFDDGRFDVVLLQHVAMNIADRTRLYRDIRRVLRSGGRFATFDVVLNSGEPRYNCPLDTNAGDQLSLSSRRDARQNRAGRFPHTCLARPHRSRQSLPNCALRGRALRRISEW